MYYFHSMKKNGKAGREIYLKPPWQIALIANLKDCFELAADDPPDLGVEYDCQETIEAITAALEADGHYVLFYSGDHTLPEALTNLRPHICFNIAEGLMGDGREAQVPALCELMGVPYTASRVVANAISLDKTRTKQIWRQHGLPTAPFQEFSSNDNVKETHLNYPLFVKPAREGTGMGIDTGAIVDTPDALVARVAWVLRTYQQPALVEEYLPGREFTVGFIGNPSDPSLRRRPELYNADGYHWFPILEIDTCPSVSPGVYGHATKAFSISEIGAPAYLCPAKIPESLRTSLLEITQKAAQALNVDDVARVDFRLGVDGNPYLIEINTLPGLNPHVSDLCIMAAAEGILYQVLITEILYLAAERFSLLPKPLAITSSTYGDYCTQANWMASNRLNMDN